MGEEFLNNSTTPEEAIDGNHIHPTLTFERTNDTFRQVFIAVLSHLTEDTMEKKKTTAQ